MTGRELILYILSNGLEDEPVFKDGKFIGFITASDAAVKFGVGVPTIYVWVTQHKLEGVLIGDTLYIQDNVELPLNDA